MFQMTTNNTVNNTVKNLVNNLVNNSVEVLSPVLVSVSIERFRALTQIISILIIIEL